MSTIAIPTLNTRVIALARTAGGPTAVYSQVAPEEAAYPFITVQKVGEAGDWETHDRAAFALRNPTWQFSCTSRDMGQARQLANALKRVLFGHADEQIRRIAFADELEDYEASTRVYRVILIVDILAYEDVAP